MKRLIATALLAGAGLAHAQTASTPPASVSPAKKELIQKLLVLQQPGVENLARTMVEQPAVQMMQAAGRALQQQVPAEKREAIGKSIEADVRKYVDESLPIVRERAVKLAPSTIGTAMEEKFNEDELRQLIGWLESPVYKKYTQVGAEIQNTFAQKLVSDARPAIEPRLQALEAKVRANLSVPADSAASNPSSVKAPSSSKAPAPAKRASGM